MGVRARFSVAVLAGLLLGVAIIASSAYYPANQVAGPSNFEKAQVTTTLTTVTAYASATTQEGASGAASSTTSNPAFVTSTTASTTASPLDAAPSFLPDSQVQSMAQRPPVSVLIAILPIVAGVILGLVFYQAASSRQREEPPSS